MCNSNNNSKRETQETVDFSQKGNFAKLTCRCAVRDRLT